MSERFQEYDETYRSVCLSSVVPVLWVRGLLSVGSLRWVLRCIAALLELPLGMEVLLVAVLLVLVDVR